MRRFWIRRGLRFLGFIILAGGLAGLAVMTLWNALLPAIIGVSTINFGQALGLLILSRLLFGGARGFGSYRYGFRRGGPGWRGGYGRHEWKQKMAERWQQMTPEQREQMKQQWRERCGRGRWGGPQREQPGQQEPTTTNA
jgi:hypothetical protein